MNLEIDASELQAHDEWLADHMDELVTRYPSKVVALHQQQVVYAAESEADVYRWIRQVQFDSMPLVLRVPSPEETYSLLTARCHAPLCVPL